MNKFLAFAIAVLFSLPTLSLGATEKAICVEGIGCGTTRQEALHDAMRKAIAKAVGMYVTTRSELKDDEYKEKIIITSDATVTNYTELESWEQNGVWLIKIKAKILPNELMKYCPKLITQKVTSTDIGNLLNKRSSMKNAEETLDEIFRNHLLNIIKFQKRGNLRLASKDDPSREEIAIQVDFVAYFDQKAYEKFQHQLRMLLDKVALQKETCYIRLGKNNNQSHGKSQRYVNSRRSNSNTSRDLTEIPNDLGFRMWQRSGLKDSDIDMGNASFIAFKNYRNGTMEYILYLVPSQIRKSIDQKIQFRRKKFIACSFLASNESKTLKRFWEISLDFYYDDRYVCEQAAGFFVSSGAHGTTYISPLTFVNEFRISRIHVDTDCFCTKTNGTLRISLPVEHVKHLKEIYIYPIDIKDDGGLDSDLELQEIADEIEADYRHKNKRKEEKIITPVGRQNEDRRQYQTNNVGKQNLTNKRRQKEEENCRIVEQKAREDLIIQANCGSHTAQCELGYHYYLISDYGLAFKWFGKSAQQGDPRGQYYFGMCFEYGLGTPKNLSEALSWYYLAASKGNGDAQSALRRLGRIR